MLKWLFTCWRSSRAPLFVISIAESPGPSGHCLSSVPALTPSQASLVIIMTTPFGVTHVFPTSPNCPSYSWGFRQLQELQMKFLPLLFKFFDDIRVQEASLFPSLPLTRPLCSPWCFLVFWFKNRKPHLLSVCHWGVLCCTCQGACPTSQQNTCRRSLSFVLAGQQGGFVWLCLLALFRSGSAFNGVCFLCSDSGLYWSITRM